MLILALALTVLGQVSDRCGARNCRSGRVDPAFSSSLAPFRLFVDYTFTAPTSTSVACNVSETCEFKCDVNSAHNAWQCKRADAGTIGTMTQGASTVYGEVWPPGTYGMLDLAASQVPTMTATTGVDYVFGQDFTIIANGYPTDRGNGFANLVDFHGYDGGVLIGGRIRVDTSTPKGTYYELTGSSPTVNGPAGALNAGWGATSMRRETHTRTIRIGATDGNATSTAATYGAAWAGVYGFGYEGGPENYLRGPLRDTRLFSSARTATWLAVDEQRSAGLPTPGGWFTASAPNTGVDNMSINGHVDVLGTTAGVITANGLRTIRAGAVTNKWAAEALAAATWTDVGTPTVASNGSAGPWYEWKHQEECDRLLDDSAGAFEGKISDDAGVLAGYYTASAYLQTGDAGTTVNKARMDFVVVLADAGTTYTLLDGGVNGACDFNITGDGGVARYSCSAQVGTADTVKARLLVGNAASDTGSITVCQAQINRYAIAGPPQVDNSSRGDSDHVVDGGAWPSAAIGGKHEVVFRPLYNHCSDYLVSDDILYLYDGMTADVDHGIVMLFGYQTACRAMARSEGDLGFTQFTEADVSLAPGQLYAASLEWRPLGGGACSVTWRFNTCSGSVASCTATTVHGSEANGYCPREMTASSLGKRKDGSERSDVDIAAVRVYSL